MNCIALLSRENVFFMIEVGSVVQNEKTTPSARGKISCRKSKPMSWPASKHMRSEELTSLYGTMCYNYKKFTTGTSNISLFLILVSCFLDDNDDSSLSSSEGNSKFMSFPGGGINNTKNLSLTGV